MPEPLRRRHIRDEITDQLRTYISERGFKPGDRLPTETALAEQFGVNRLSLREATKALEFLGIIESKRGVGLTVGRLTLGRMTQHLGFHPGLQDASPVQLVETRIVIETGVLPYVLRRMETDPGVYERLNAINQRLRGIRDLGPWIEGDIEFHHRLVEASGLVPLLAFNDLLAAFFQRFRESVKRGGLESAIEGHQALIDALKAGRLDAACEALRAHIQDHLRRAAAP